MRSTLCTSRTGRTRMFALEAVGWDKIQDKQRKGPCRVSSRIHWHAKCLALRPENAGGRGGGDRKEGGGAKPHKKNPPTENRFQPPSPRYLLPQAIFLPNSVRKFQECPLDGPLKSHLRRVSKHGFQVAILARFCSSVRSAPPPLALPRIPRFRELDAKRKTLIFPSYYPSHNHCTYCLLFEVICTQKRVVLHIKLHLHYTNNRSGIIFRVHCCVEQQGS